MAVVEMEKLNSSYSVTSTIVIDRQFVRAPQEQSEERVKIGHFFSLCLSSCTEPASSHDVCKVHQWRGFVCSREELT